MKVSFLSLHLIVISSALFACKTQSVKKASLSNATGGGGESYQATRYEESFSFSCAYTNIIDLKQKKMLIAVTESSPLLKAVGYDIICPDNWQDFSFEKPRWESDHWLATMPREKAIGIISQYPNSFRKVGDKWQLNEPQCGKVLEGSKVCGMKVKVGAVSHVTNNQTIPLPAKELDAVIYDICPEQHWNNAIKDHKDHPHNKPKGNPCKRGTTNVDIHGDLWSALGYPWQVSTAFATLKLQ